MWPEEQEIEIASFNEYGSTEELIAAHEAESEEWTQVDHYRVDGKVLRLLKSTFGRYRVAREWLFGTEAGMFTFQSVDRAMEVFDANQRLMERKWFSAQPPPAGWGKF